MGFLRSFLSLLSGGGEREVSEQLLFDKVIGFRGIVDGVGCSTIVQNVAVALSDTTRYKIAVVDTSMLYPCMAEMLKCDTSDIKFDISDYGRGTDLGKVALDSKYNNVSVFTFHNRTVLDMVSVTEDLKLFDKLIDELKNFYDVILIDLSQEPTNFATEAAIKCNKIFLVSDLSIRCTSNIVNSVNYLATLGVSMSKCKRMIINKDTNIVSGIKSVLSVLGIDIFARIPMSKTIYARGIGGNPVWGMASVESEITSFHIAIQNLIDDISEKTPKNEKYLVKDTDSNVEKSSAIKDTNLDEHIDLFGDDKAKDKGNTVISESKNTTEIPVPQSASIDEQKVQSVNFDKQVVQNTSSIPVNQMGYEDDEDDIAPTFIEKRRG